MVHAAEPAQQAAGGLEQRGWPSFAEHLSLTTISARRQACEEQSGTI